jgi:hypothetical protein
MARFISAKEAHKRAETASIISDYVAEKFNQAINNAANLGEFNVKIYGRFCLAEIEFLENQGYKVIYAYDEGKQNDYLKISW